MNKAKLIIVGEATVGKTSIILQYNENQFIETYITTIGNDKILKEFSIKGKNFKIEIWDTAGQEKYRTVNKIFMKNTQIALIVYSIIDKNSFEQLNFWINLVKEVNKDKKIIFGIAANKSDLFESQIVSFEEGKKFADENDCLFFETSAKDHKSIENLFQKLAEKYAECNLNEKVEIKSLETTDNNNQISGNENDKNNEMFQQNENENIIINKDDDDKTCSSRC